MVTKKNNRIIIIAVVVIGILFFSVQISVDPIQEDSEGTIEVTIYTCGSNVDSQGRVICTESILGDPFSIIGGVEGATHFSLAVTAGPIMLRDIDSFKINKDTDTPATTVDFGGASGTASFFDALRNNGGLLDNPDPPGPVMIGNSATWDTKHCREPFDSGSGSCGSPETKCLSDSSCNLGEQCITVGPDSWCAMRAVDFEGISPTDVYTFTVAIEGTYTDSQSIVRTVTNTGSIALTIEPDLTGQDLFDINVAEGTF